MALRIRSSSGGKASGEVSSINATLPFSGTVQNGKLTFTTSADGEVIRWEAIPSGNNLRLTMRADNGESQTFALVRRAAASNAGAPLARQWQQRLTGRGFTLTERTGGGSSGGATKETSIAFCPGGKALLEERFALNVSVPGMGGGQTSRNTMGARWRAVSSGNSASVEFAGEGETFQLGIRAGSQPDILIVGGKPARLYAAGAKCSHPALDEIQ